MSTQCLTWLIDVLGRGFGKYEKAFGTKQALQVGENLYYI